MMQLCYFNKIKLKFDFVLTDLWGDLVLIQGSRRMKKVGGSRIKKKKWIVRIRLLNKPMIRFFYFLFLEKKPMISFINQNKACYESNGMFKSS